MNQFPRKNYFTLPNEIFSLGLGAGEIAVYAYLRCLETPAPTSAGPATPRSEKLLAVQKIRSCSMSMRSRRKDSSPQSQPLS